MKSNFLEKVRSYKIFRVVKIIAESAAFALVISLILFGIEMFDNMKTSQELSKNLLEIQNSLSTKYLGKFPDFMPDINRLYEGAKAGDSIVIMEDVLFYGINSAPVDFYEASLKLFDLAANGSQVMISYYIPDGMAFNFMLQELLLSQKQYKNYRDTLMLFYQRSHLYKREKMVVIDSCVANNFKRTETDREIASLLDKYFGDIFEQADIEKQKERMIAHEPSRLTENDGNSIASRSDNALARALLIEKFFEKTKKEDLKSFQSMVAMYRRPTMIAKVNESSTRIQLEAQSMCLKMDSIRIKYLGRDNTPVDKIKYSDFKNMFAEMTKVMEESYHRYPSITLVPIDEFISVRSWLVESREGAHKAIMAFPSRYSSSEIGFFTTDETTRDYIKTMQKGILINYSKN